MSARTIELVRNLCATWSSVRPLWLEHLEDNEGEVLPHLLLSDVVRWMSSSELEPHRARCDETWRWLAVQYQSGDSDVRDLIVVSGVKMIPDPGSPGSGQRAFLDPQLRALDPWR